MQMASRPRAPTSTTHTPSVWPSARPASHRRPMQVASSETPAVLLVRRELCLSARKLGKTPVGEPKNEKLTSFKSISSIGYSFGSWKPVPKQIKKNPLSQKDLSQSLCISEPQTPANSGLMISRAGRSMQTNQTLASVAGESVPQHPKASTKFGFMSRLWPSNSSNNILLLSSSKRSRSTSLPKAMGDVSDDPALELETEHEIKSQKQSCREGRGGNPTFLDHSLFLKGINSNIIASSVVLQPATPTRIKKTDNLQMMYFEKINPGSDKQSASKESEMIADAAHVPSWFEELNHKRRFSKDFGSADYNKVNKYMDTKLQENQGIQGSQEFAEEESKKGRISALKVSDRLRPEPISSKLRLSSVNRSSLALDTNIDLEKVLRASDARKHLAIALTSIKCIAK